MAVAGTQRSAIAEWLRTFGCDHEEDLLSRLENVLRDGGGSSVLDLRHLTESEVTDLCRPLNKFPERKFRSAVAALRGDGHTTTLVPTTAPRTAESSLVASPSVSRRSPGPTSPSSQRPARKRAAQTSTNSEESNASSRFVLHVRASYEKCFVQDGERCPYEKVYGNNQDHCLRNLLAKVRGCNRYSLFYPAKPAGFQFNNHRKEPHSEILETSLATAELNPGDLVESVSNPEWFAILCVICNRHTNGRALDQAVFLRSSLLGGRERTNRDEIPPHFDHLNDLLSHCGPVCAELKCELQQLHGEYQKKDNLASIVDPVGRFMLRHFQSAPADLGGLPRQVSEAGVRESYKKQGPAVGAAPFAVLTALHLARTSNGSVRNALTEQELRYEAQSWCGSDLTASPAWSKGHGAWGSVKSLKEAELVRAEETTDRDGVRVETYTLVDTQRSSNPRLHDLARKCAEFNAMLRRIVEKPLLEDALVMRQDGNGKIVLLADDKEGGGKDDLLKRLQKRCEEARTNISVKVCSLPVGDYAWVFRDKDGVEHVLPFVVERKAFPHDLHQSIEDGRLRNQMNRMSSLSAETTKIILLEGHHFCKDWDRATGKEGRQSAYEADLRTVDEESLKGGFQVQWTVHNNHTVEWLIIMSKFISMRYCQDGADDPLTGITLDTWGDTSSMGRSANARCLVDGPCKFLNTGDVARSIDSQEYRNPPENLADMPIHYVLEEWPDASSSIDRSYSQRRDNKLGGPDSLYELWNAHAGYRGNELTLDQVANKIAENRQRYLSFRVLSLWSCWQIAFKASYVRSVRNQTEADDIEALRESLIQGEDTGSPAVCHNTMQSRPTSAAATLRAFTDHNQKEDLVQAVHKLPRRNDAINIKNLDASMGGQPLKLDVVVSHRATKPTKRLLNGVGRLVVNFVLMDRTGSIAATAWGDDNATEWHEQLELGKAYSLNASRAGKGKAVGKLSGVNRHTGQQQDPYFISVLRRRDDFHDLNIRTDLELKLNGRWALQGRSDRSSPAALSSPRQPFRRPLPSPVRAPDTARQSVTHTIKELRESLGRGDDLSNTSWSIRGQVAKYINKPTQQGRLVALILDDGTEKVALKAYDDAIDRVNPPTDGVPRWKHKHVWIYKIGADVSPSQPSIVDETKYNDPASEGCIDWAINLEPNVEVGRSPRAGMKATSPISVSPRSPGSPIQAIVMSSPVPVGPDRTCDYNPMHEVTVCELGTAVTEGCGWCLKVEVVKNKPSKYRIWGGNSIDCRDVVLKDSDGSKIVLHAVGKNKPKKFKGLKIGETVLVSGNDKILKQHREDSDTAKNLKDRCNKKLGVRNKWYIDGCKSSKRAELHCCHLCDAEGRAHYTVMDDSAKPPNQSTQNQAGPPSHPRTNQGLPLPQCPYGGHCYRQSNPQHIAQFSHPAPEDAEPTDSHGRTSPGSDFDTGTWTRTSPLSTRHIPYQEMERRLSPNAASPDEGSSRGTTDDEAILDSGNQKATTNEVFTILDELRQQIGSVDKFRAICDDLHKVLSNARDEEDERFRRLSPFRIDSIQKYVQVRQLLYLAGFQKSTIKEPPNGFSLLYDDGTRFILHTKACESDSVLTELCNEINRQRLSQTPSAAVDVPACTMSQQRAGQSISAGLPPTTMVLPAKLTEMGFSEWKCRIAFETQGHSLDQAVEMLVSNIDRHDDWWRAQSTGTATARAVPSPHTQSPDPVNFISPRDAALPSPLTPQGDMQLPRGVFKPPRRWQYAPEELTGTRQETLERWNAGEDLKEIATTGRDDIQDGRRPKTIQESTVCSYLLDALTSGEKLDLQRLVHCCMQSSDGALNSGPPNHQEWINFQCTEWLNGGEHDVTGPLQKGRACGGLTAKAIVERMVGGQSEYDNLSNLETRKRYFKLQWWVALRRIGFTPTFEQSSRLDRHDGVSPCAQLSNEYGPSTQNNAIDPLLGSDKNPDRTGLVKDDESFITTDSPGEKTRKRRRSENSPGTAGSVNWGEDEDQATPTNEFADEPVARPQRTKKRRGSGPVTGGVSRCVSPGLDNTGWEHESPVTIGHTTQSPPRPDSSPSSEYVDAGTDDCATATGRTNQFSPTSPTIVLVSSSDDEDDTNHHQQRQQERASRNTPRPDSSPSNEYVDAGTEDFATATGRTNQFSPTSPTIVLTSSSDDEDDTNHHQRQQECGGCEALWLGDSDDEDSEGLLAPLSAH